MFVDGEIILYPCGRERPVVFDHRLSILFFGEVCDVLPSVFILFYFLWCFVDMGRVTASKVVRDSFLNRRYLNSITVWSPVEMMVMIIVLIVVIIVIIVTTVVIIVFMVGI
ncbi:unnamed protein product [Choristocarpus tenellus]